MKGYPAIFGTLSIVPAVSLETAVAMGCSSTCALLGSDNGILVIRHDEDVILAIAGSPIHSLPFCSTVMAQRQDPEKFDIVADSDTKASSDYDKNCPEARPPPSYDPIIDRYSEAEIRKIVRKIDLRLVPLCGLMYCVSLLDRINLSSAAIAG